MSLASRLKKRALGFSQQALERMLSDDGRAQQLARALGSMQRGKRAVDSTQRLVLHQLNFATKADFRDLGKTLAGLKKRLKLVDEKVSKVS